MEAKEALRASAWWGECGGPCLLGLFCLSFSSSTTCSHFSGMFCRRDTDSCPVSQICTLHQKIISKNCRIREVWEGIKGIYKENNFKLNPSILKYSVGLISQDLSHLRTCWSQLFSCPLIGFCLPAFSSVLPSPCLKQACSLFCSVAASPADTHALRVSHSIRIALSKFFPKERPFSLWKVNG